MVAVYLAGHFEAQIKEAKDEENFEESDFKKLFEFSRDVGARCTGQDVGDLKKPQFSSKFIRRHRYSHLDFLDHYENRRYSTPFLVYKLMDWWPFFDICASYGHLVNNFVVVWLAINYSVSAFMAFNVICVCAFYTLATMRLQQRATTDFLLSGLLGQTDLGTANAITRQYKIGAFYEFLQVRRTMWRVQIVALVIAAVLGFPSTLLVQYREKLLRMPATELLSPEAVKGSLESVDWWTFWFFIAGVFKDQGQGADSSQHNSNVFYGTLGMMAVSLALEKQAANWLTNRWGCTPAKL